MAKTEYNPGKFGPFIKIVARLAVQYSDLYLTNYNQFLLKVVDEIPELKNATRCPNCDASMVEYIFEFDSLDAIMLFQMAKEVRRRMNPDKREQFTVANQVRVQRLQDATYAMKSRTTQMSKLGLIAKLQGANGHQVPGTWVITKRGWAALRGEPVPRFVKVWRGRIEARGEETITISQALKNHKEKVENAIALNKSPKNDYRHLFVDYKPEQWYQVGEVHQGKLI